MTLEEELLAAVDKFEKDLAFTAPELTSMRIDLLRTHIKNIVADFMAHGEAKVSANPMYPQDITETHRRIYGDER